MALQELSLDAWRNGHWLPASALSLSVHDAGFVHGVAVAEQVRTFDGRPFRSADHVQRLLHSLKMVGGSIDYSGEQLQGVIEQIASRNYPRLPKGGDLRIILWVTPGDAGLSGLRAASGPVVCCHAEPLCFADWARNYATGVRLVTSRHRQLSPLNWSPAVKSRSRLHYYLADKEAREIDPAARGLLLDMDGFVCEASTANIVAYFQGLGLVSPRREKILPGISLAVMEEIALSQAIPFQYRDITRAEFYAADEVWLTSTPWCGLPVIQVDGQTIGDGSFGQFQWFLRAWGREVGVDIVAQAMGSIDS